jgi:hypothetical protein
MFPEAFNSVTLITLVYIIIVITVVKNICINTAVAVAIAFRKYISPPPATFTNSFLAR